MVENNPEDEMPLFLFSLSESLVFLTLNNNLSPPFLSHTYQNLGPAVSRDGAALLIKSASFKPKLLTSDIRHCLRVHTKEPQSRHCCSADSYSGF